MHVLDILNKINTFCFDNQLDCEYLLTSSDNVYEVICSQTVIDFDGNEGSKVNDRAELWTVATCETIKELENALVGIALDLKSEE